MNSSLSNSPVAGHKGLRITLWVLQGLLCLLFLFAGGMKLVASPAQLASMPLPLGLIRFIGVLEVAGGIGVLLPAALRILPVLTPVAGLGLAVLMVCAAGFNVAHGMAGTAGFPLAIGAIAAFVAWGRWVKAPIAPTRQAP